MRTWTEILTKQIKQFYFMPNKRFFANITVHQVWSKSNAVKQTLSSVAFPDCFTKLPVQVRIE